MATVTGKESSKIDQLLGDTLVGADLDSAGSLTFTKKNGATVNAGSLGLSLVSATINAAKRLIFTKMDGSTLDAGSIIPNVLDTAWPVGSIYFGSTSTNPNVLLGGGTWVQFAKGRVVVGVDSAQPEFDAAEETGGEKEVTLTVAELPAHKHSISHDHPTASGGTGTVNSATFEKGGGTGSITNNNLVQPPTVPDSGNTGGGESHNNLQPYITAYIWKRTA